MIKTLVTSVIILFSLASCGRIDNTVYPGYEEVVKKFYTIYSPAILPEESEIKFEKRPDGWHITKLDAATFKNIYDELFWSKKSKSFLELKLKKVSENSTEENQENKSRMKYALRSWDKRNYDFSPYYGYAGWDKDVIDDYEDINGLPDSTLYALARAYSSYSGNLISINSGHDLPERFDLPDGQNCMTEKQLELYRKYQYLALENYKKVKALNPNFETLVGSIDTKLSNEQMAIFLNLRIYQNEEEAKKELSQGLYNDFILSFAKNMLNSCEKNAILFTYGDTDTYPLLYIQSQYGIRPDVLVVNLSLLQTDRYINSLRNKILSADPLPVSYSPAQIKVEKRELILINKNADDKPWELSKMISFIADDDNTYSTGTANYPYIPTDQLQLTTPNGTISWKAKGSYFLKNDLIICDVLANTKLNRPIYYSATGLTGNFLNINNYLQQEGLVNRLVVANQKESDFEFADVNTANLYTNLMSLYDWKGLKTMTPNEYAICSAYRVSFQILIYDLIAKNQKDSARKVLNKCMELIPDNLLHYDIYTTSLIQAYYQIGDFKKGNEISKVLIYNIKHNIDNYKNRTYDSNNEGWQEEIAERLSSILEQYNQEELLKELQKN